MPMPIISTTSLSEKRIHVVVVLPLALLRLLLNLNLAALFVRVLAR